MEFRKDQFDYVLRFDQGDEIVSKLTKFAEMEGVKLAEVSAIGACSQAEVGVYSLAKKKYFSKTYVGDIEIASLNGNITTKDGNPYLHLHTVMADEEGNIIAGHLNRAVVSVTCEMFVRVVNGNMDRQMNDKIGINLMKFN